MRLVRFLCIGILASLAGCATLTPEERRVRDEQECRSYGFTPRTDAFAECLQRIELDRRAQQRYQMLRMEQWNEPRVIYRPVIVRRN